MRARMWRRSVSTWFRGARCLSGRRGAVGGKNFALSSRAAIFILRQLDLELALGGVRALSENISNPVRSKPRNRELSRDFSSAKEIVRCRKL